MSQLDHAESIAVLTYRNDAARDNALLMTSGGIDCVYIPAPPVNDIANESSWVYISLAQYLMLGDYSDYDFIYANPLLEEAEAALRARIRITLNVLMQSISNDIAFNSALKSLFETIGLPEPMQDDISKLINTVKDPEQYSIYFGNRKHNCQSLTFHSSKGLEFNQVVLFVDDYQLTNPDDVNNHYVASTRTEQKLILTSSSIPRARTYYRQAREMFARSGVDINSIIQVIGN